MGLFHPKVWLNNQWLVIDEGFNSLLGGAPDETFSGRMGRYQDSKGWRKAIGNTVGKSIDAVAWVLTRKWGHCRSTAEHEKSIVHRPESLGDEPGD